ncbi:MAG: hypothetical protein ABH878_07150 [bacterium]
MIRSAKGMLIGLSVVLYLGMTEVALGAEINTAGKLFLLNPGARASGLGGGSALLGEAFSGLYNPASLTRISDLAGGIYYHSKPYYVTGYEYVVFSAAARTEFGCLAMNYLTRDGVESTNLPPEEAAAFLMAGSPLKRLSLGVGFKILTSKKANFVAVNEAPGNTYKMAFDLGAAYYGLLPQATFGKPLISEDDLRRTLGGPFPRGFSFALAIQNLGGRVKYDYSIDIEMLPQTFRADWLWGIYEDRWLSCIAVGELEKLLVSRNRNGGYNAATDAIFQAWGGGEMEGGWTSRLGFELDALCFFAVRLGWSVEHKEHRSFTHFGIGLGPQWLRASVAWVRQPGSDAKWRDGARYDLTANVTFERVQRWMNLQR